jgi:hypothetical protein
VTVGSAGTVALTVSAGLATASVVVAIAPDATVSTVLVASVALATTVSTVFAAGSATGFVASVTVCVLPGAGFGVATVDSVGATAEPAAAVVVAAAGTGGGRTARDRSGTFACADACRLGGGVACARLRGRLTVVPT